MRGTHVTHYFILAGNWRKIVERFSARVLELKRFPSSLPDETVRFGFQ